MTLSQPLHGIFSIKSSKSHLDPSGFGSLCGVKLGFRGAVKLGFIISVKFGFIESWLPGVNLGCSWLPGEYLTLTEELASMVSFPLL